MKKLLAVLFSTLILVISGCQTTTPQSSSSELQSTASNTWASPNLDIAGSWVLLFNNQGANYSLNAEVVTDGKLVEIRLSGSGEMSTLKFTGRKAKIQTFNNVLKGKLDPDTGAFTVTDTNNPRSLALDGLFSSPDQFAAKIIGSFWENASLTVGVRKSKQKYLTKLLTQKNSIAKAFLNRSALGQIANIGNDKCSKYETDWMERVAKEIDAYKKDDHGVKPEVFAISLYSNDIFKQTTKKNLNELSYDDGWQMAYALEKSKGCGQFESNYRQVEYILRMATTTLRNSDPNPRYFTIAQNMAFDILKIWGESIGYKAENIVTNYHHQPVVGLKKLEAIDTALQNVSKLFWNPNSQQFSNQLTIAKNDLTKRVFYIALKEHLKEVDTFEKMNVLANLPESYSDSYQALTPNERAQVKSTITEILNNPETPNIVTAAKEFSDNQHTVLDILNNLGAIEKGKFHRIAQYSSIENLNQVQSIFVTRSNQIIAENIDNSRLRLNEVILSNTSDEYKLRELVSLRNDFSRKHSRLSNSQLIINYKRETQIHSETLLSKLEPDISSKIQNARYLSDIANILDGLITFEDSYLPTVSRLRRTYNNKRDQLLAFNPVSNPSVLTVGSFNVDGLNYADDLMAIYIGDFNNSRFKNVDLLTMGFFKYYVYAYGRYCDDYLPANKVELTEEVCTQDTVTYHDFIEYSRQCSQWRTVPTGLWAKPYMRNTMNEIETNAGLGLLGSFFSRGGLSTTLSLAFDLRDNRNLMGQVISKNYCANAGLNRFEDNFFNLVNGRAPIKLPGNETISTLQKARSGF